MKTLLIFALAILLSISCFSQVPEGLNYQAVVRNSNGEILSNKPFQIRFSVVINSPNGTIEFSETHTDSTNSLGLANLVIGKGNPVTSSFDQIDWSNGIKFLKIEIDVDMSGNFIFMGTTQLMSVPYSMYAKEAEKVKERGSSAKTLLYLSK